MYIIVDKEKTQNACKKFLNYLLEMEKEEKEKFIKNYMSTKTFIFWGRYPSKEEANKAWESTKYNIKNTTMNVSYREKLIYEHKNIYNAATTIYNQSIATNSKDIKVSSSLFNLISSYI